MCTDAIGWDPSIAGRGGSWQAAPLVYAWDGASFEPYPYDRERTAEAFIVWAKEQLVADPPARPSSHASVDTNRAAESAGNHRRGTASDAAAAAAATAAELLPGKLQVWPGQALPTQVFLPAASGAALTRRKERLPILVYLHGSPQTGAPGDRPPEPDPEARSNYFARDGFLPRLLADNDTFASGFGFIGIFPCSACVEPDGAPVRLHGGPPQSGPYGWQPDNFRRIDTIVAAAVRLLHGDPARVVLAGTAPVNLGHVTCGVWRVGGFAVYMRFAPSIRERAPWMCLSGVNFIGTEN